MAFQLALLHEELGDGLTPQNSASVPTAATPHHRVTVAPLALPSRAPTQFRSPEDRLSPDHTRTTAAEDKWLALKAYR